MDHLFGDAENARPLADEGVTASGINPQLIFPLAFVYTTEAPNNNFTGNPAVLKTIENIAEWAFDKEEIPRRVPYTLIKAFELLRADLGDAAARWKDGLQRVVRATTLAPLMERRRITKFSSANVGYGTNHLAMELSALAAYVAAFRDDENFGDMDPGGEQLVEFASAYLQRFVDYMHKDGYWAESDGPAISYNVLTGHATYLAARDLGEVDKHREKLKQAARFHVVTMFPNLSMIEIVNGRSQFRKGAARPSFFGLHDDGKILRDKLVEFYENKQLKDGQHYDGQMMTYLLASHLTFADQGPGEKPFIWDGPDRTETLSDNFAVVRRKKWIAAVSNMDFRPRPEGHWNLDFTGLIAVYHDQFGSVLYGCNSKNDPLISTFHKQFDSFDGSPLPAHAHDWKYIPGPGWFRPRPDGVELMREYRGFEGFLNFKAVDNAKAVLDIQANIRMSDYPVEAALQPPIRYGAEFVDGLGISHRLSQEPLRISGGDLGGSIRVQPEQTPHYFRQVKPKPVTIRMGDDAILYWPHAMWNPYDRVHHRFHSIEEQSALLLVPVGPKGAQVVFEVG